MASNTPNIGLYKVNPATDGNLTFNIETMLNQNWDKIDAEIGNMPKKDGTLQTGLNAEKVGGKTVSELAPASHTHTKADITDLSTANLLVPKIILCNSKTYQTGLQELHYNNEMRFQFVMEGNADFAIYNYDAGVINPKRVLTIRDNDGQLLNNDFEVLHKGIFPIEYGTWTPTLCADNVSGNHVYSIRVGKYYRIDKIVHVSFSIKLTNKDATMAGGIYISGLPFAALTDYEGGSINNFEECNIGSGYIPTLATIGNANLRVKKISYDGSQQLNITANEVSNSFAIAGTLIYRIN